MGYILTITFYNSTITFYLFCIREIFMLKRLEANIFIVKGV